MSTAEVKKAVELDRFKQRNINSRHKNREKKNLNLSKDYDTAFKKPNHQASEKIIDNTN